MKKTWWVVPAVVLLTIIGIVAYVTSSMLGKPDREPPKPESSELVTEKEFSAEPDAEKTVETEK